MNQPQQQQQNPNANTEITLSQINEMLNDAGFPIIGKEKVAALQNVAPRETIIRAIRSAKADPGARTYLQNKFAQVDIPIGNQQGHMPQDNGAAGPAPQATGGQPQDQGYNNQPIPQQQESRPGTAQGQPSSQGNTPQQNAKMNPEDRVSMHVYGGKAALCFEADMTKQGVPTVALDAASSTAPRQYNWSAKVRLQMTRSELPVVAAVLLGVLPSCEFNSHGQENNKGFAMERQNGGKVFVKVFAKGEPVRSVPVMASDVFYVTSLVIRQMRKANPWLDTMGIMGLIKATQAGQ